MIFDPRLLSGAFLGWSLGSNDSANVFGTAVATRMVRFRTAVILCSVFVILGAVTQGEQGFHTLSGLVEQNFNQAFFCSLGAALCVTIMSTLGLPVSTSQAMVGSIIGVGLATGQTINTKGLGKVVACWIGTPIGSLIIAFILYWWLSRLFKAWQLDFFQSDFIYRWGLILAGVYGSYALGANNVANVTGVYVSAGVLNTKEAALLGGVSIAIGAITYSKNVMMTVGQNLISLNGLGALVAVASHAIVVHFYAMVGVPVSTSQAIVGGVVAVGLINGRSINKKALFRVLQGWMFTPVIAGAFTMILIKSFQ
jgi:PiT family inorganic phosphate transporter